MRNLFTRRGTAGKAALLGALLTGAAIAPAAAQVAYGLAYASTSTAAPSLVTFNVATPGTLTATVAITNLGSGQSLVGLDTRPATGELFALGYNPTGTQAQLYTLNRTTGALTTVGAALTLDLGTNINRVGFDFNPTVDRIRVTSGARTNFRLNPNNGALAFTDGTLTYATTDANAGQTPLVGASAYTNSYIGSTATTLYNIDEAANRLVTQVPPNDGILNTIATITNTSASTAISTDLDIYFNTATTPAANVAYLAASFSGTAANNATLYTLNLTSGAATSVGAIGPAAVNVYDIALAIDRTVPATITGQLVYALAGTNLVTFDSALPGTIRTSVGITGVDATQTLVGMDIRPANNSLYALGYNAAAASGVANSQLYALNAVSGVATPINIAFRLELGTGSVGFDFNPTVDRIRVVAANRNNYRLNPNIPAATPLAFTDGILAYATGTAVPSIGAAAYTNSFPGAGSTSTTTLYTYDEAANTINTQVPPNDGTQNTVGSSGIVVNTATPTAVNVDLDIYSPASGTNSAYLVANTGTSANTSLYTVNLTTGAATLVGAIGNGIAARDIAVAINSGVVTGTRATAGLAGELGLYPNPLTEGTSLSFNLARAARVELVVSDALGRTLATVDAGQLPAGPQAVRWARGTQAAGLYYFTLRLDGQPAGTRTGVVE